jgi:hypothetical protein
MVAELRFHICRSLPISNNAENINLINSPELSSTYRDHIGHFLPTEHLLSSNAELKSLCGSLPNVEHSTLDITSDRFVREMEPVSGAKENLGTWKPIVSVIKFFYLFLNMYTYITAIKSELATALSPLASIKSLSISVIFLRGYILSGTRRDAGGKYFTGDPKSKSKGNRSMRMPILSESSSLKKPKDRKTSPTDQADQTS